MYFCILHIQKIMRSHFSILFATIRPDIEEKISVGLILVDSNSVFFRYSENKLTIVKELLTLPAFEYLNEILHQISKEANGEKEKLKGVKTESRPISQSFSLGYLDYLSRYSNNLLTFSSPKIIDLQTDEQLFERLFKKYIDEK